MLSAWHTSKLAYDNEMSSRASQHRAEQDEMRQRARVESPAGTSSDTSDNAVAGSDSAGGKLAVAEGGTAAVASKKRLFVSYAREDRAFVASLVESLRILRCEVWVDDILAGGQSWWDVILEQIRSCDATVIVVSPSSLRSVACMREIDYALDLERPVLPVIAEAVEWEALPAKLAGIQMIDFRDRSLEGGLRLAAATLDVGFELPLPSKMPKPPRAPISYLARIREQILVSDLGPGEQYAIVAQLEDPDGEKSDRGQVLEIIELMLGQDYTLHSVARRLTKIRDAGELGPPVASHAVSAGNDERKVADQSARTPNRRRTAYRPAGPPIDNGYRA